jgi:hypothetical protein
LSPLKPLLRELESLSRTFLQPWPIVPAGDQNVSWRV